MMNEFESGLVYNFEKLGCKGLAEKLSGIFSSTHVRDSELLSPSSLQQPPRRLCV